MPESLKLRMCEICQQTSYIENLDNMIKIIKDCPAVESYAYIVHNQDVDSSGNLKPEHVHIMIRFHYSYNVLTLAKQLGIKEQYLQKIQSRNFEDALLYLTHLNAPEKFQYPPDLVKSNISYKAICARYLQKKAAAQTSTSEKEKVKLICQEIFEGKIRLYNYFDSIDTDLYTRYRSRFENAFKMRQDKLKTQERSQEVIYMTGDSGTGKTSLAKRIAKEKGYSYFVSSASNDILDSYAGQDCIILDDLRPSCLSLSDLLKLLDNNTSSTAKSRYYNKILECKLIIVTTVINIEDFFSTVFKEHDEPLVQLKRRCATYFEFTKQEIRVSKYNNDLQDYEYFETLKNPIATLFPSKELTAEQVSTELKCMLGDLYVQASTEDWLTVEESPFPLD